MLRRQEIYYGVAGQSFWYDADRRPSSPTVTIHENTDGDATVESATTGAAAADTVNTTVSVASGAGTTNARLVTLTSSTGIVVGRRYLLTSTLGAMEIGEVLIVGTGYVILRHPLANAYAIAATFQGLRILISVLDAWAATEANVSTGTKPVPRYRGRFEFTAGGAVVVRSICIDLVRYQSSHGVTAQDIDAHFPGWLDHLPTYYREDQGRTLIDAAFDAVRFDLRLAIRATQMARDAEAIAMLTVRKANALAQEHRLARGSGSVEAVEAARSGYNELLAALVGQIPFDTGATGAASTSIDRSQIFQQPGQQ